MRMRNYCGLVLYAMRINVELIECDILKFNKLIDARNRANADERVLYMEKATELYQGLPFEDGYYTWSNAIQSNYEYRYVELLDSLIAYYQKNADKQKAGFYEKKLKTI